MPSSEEEKYHKIPTASTSTSAFQPVQPTSSKPPNDLLTAMALDKKPPYFYNFFPPSGGNYPTPSASNNPNGPLNQPLGHAHHHHLLMLAAAHQQQQHHNIAQHQVST